MVLLIATTTTMSVYLSPIAGSDDHANTPSNVMVGGGGNVRVRCV